MKQAITGVTFPVHRPIRCKLMTCCAAAVSRGMKGEFCELCVFKETCPSGQEGRSFFQQPPQMSFDLVQHVI